MGDVYKKHGASEIYILNLETGGKEPMSGKKVAKSNQRKPSARGTEKTGKNKLQKGAGVAMRMEFTAMAAVRGTKTTLGGRADFLNRRKGLDGQDRG